MKNLIALFVLIFFISCNQKKTRLQAEKLKQDSILLANETRLKDSLAKIEMQKEIQRIEVSKTAFGGAKFEMSVKEVMETDVFKDGSSGIDWAQPKNYYYPVGKYQYNVRAKFRNDSLYMVTFDSGSENAAYIEDKLLFSANNLKDVISAKYGQPQKVFGVPSVMDFNPGQTRWMYEWQIEEKVIRIGMSELSSGSKYLVNARIYYKPVYDKIARANNDRNQEQINRDASKF